MRRIAAVDIALLIASGERFLLLVGLQLRQQERVAHADFVLGESLGDSRGKFRKAGAGDDVGSSLSHFRGDLLRRVIKVQQGDKPVRLV